jgi:hypothetical protein
LTNESFRDGIKTFKQQKGVEAKNFDVFVSISRGFIWQILEIFM